MPLYAIVVLPVPAGEASHTRSAPPFLVRSFTSVWLHLPLAGWLLCVRYPPWMQRPGSARRFWPSYPSIKLVSGPLTRPVSV